MSESEWRARARWVILEYLKPSSVTLPQMSDLHERLMGEDVKFTRWNDVADQYSEHSWNRDKYRRFLQLSKEAVEGGIDELAETYFEIVLPEDVTRADIVEAFSEDKWSPDNDELQMSITYYEQDNGIIAGEFIYKTINTDITNDFTVRRLENQKPVPFRVNSSENLVIVESTSASRVQRLRGALNHETMLQLNICGNLTVLPGLANGKVEDFRSEFTISEENSPEIRQIKDVYMYNPSTQSDEIKRIDYKGGDNGDIFNHEMIESRKSENWIVRGFLSKISYQGVIFEMSVSGTSQMGYVKISDVPDIDIGNELMDDLRDAYMAHIR